MGNLNTLKGLLGVALVSLLLFSNTAFAQQRVTGRVTDANSQPLLGVNVIVLGTTVGTTTDAKGNFAITMPENKKRLIFSFLGYTNDTVNVGNRTMLKVVLKEIAEEIDEVVVVGFGSMRRSDIGGAVTSVKIDENEATQVNTLDQLLKGRAAGVQVTTDNAAPGGAVSILIRGAGSFNSSTEPLYVVDGVMLNPPGEDMGNATTTGVSIGNEEQNGLTGINPQDIASMEILKDASATAIYGSLGANGVVLITTKQGTSSKPVVTYNATLAFDEMPKKIDMLSFDEYRAYQEAMGKSTTSWDTYKPMDWQDWFTRTAVSHKHRITISGRGKTTNYYIAGGYAKNNGIIKTTGTEVSDFRFNFTKNVGKFVKISTQNTMSYAKYSMTAGSDPMQQTNTSMVQSMVNWRPYMTPNENFDEMDEDDLSVSQGSPYAWSTGHSDNTYEYRVRSALNVDVKLFKWLTYQLKLGIDYRAKSRTKWFSENLYAGRTKNGYINKASNTNLSYNMDHLFMFNKTFNKIHRLSGTLGMQLRQTNGETTGYQAWRIYDQGLWSDSFNSALDYGMPQYGESESSLASFFLRAVYSYRNKYVLTGTYRIDGSSKFAKRNRYSSFPSFSFAWRINEEKAFNLPKQISNLKLRFGWGRVGNQGVGSYQTLDMYSITRYFTQFSESGYVFGLSPQNLPNPDLKWETTEQWNIGLDIGLFNNRVNFVAEAYSKKTKDLLQQSDISPSAGFSRWWINRGVIRNNGLEFSLDATLIESRGFSWNVGGNISFNRNKIVDIGLPPSNDRYTYFLGNKVGGSSGFAMPANIYIQGKPMGLFYGYKTNGIVQEGDYSVPSFIYQGDAAGPGGQVYYVDTNNDGSLDAEDCVILGNPNPDFTYGFTTNFSYKGITLSAVFNGVYGNDMVNGNLMQQWFTGSSPTGPVTSTNIRKEAFYNAWTPENPNTNFPKLGGDGAYYKLFSDRLIQDGSFLRLANVTLSYKIPMKKVKAIQSINVSVAANNLFVITDYNGFDPEVNSFRGNSMRQGIDWNAYPHSRTYLVGLGITF